MVTPIPLFIDWRARYLTAVEELVALKADVLEAAKQDALSARWRR